MRILVTGSAGFIGFSFCKKILKNKRNKVTGIDNLNTYYSTKLKKKRIEILNKNKNFSFFKMDISNKFKLEKIFKKDKFDLIYNFAAQAGVRYSFNDPHSYFKSNITGFNNIIDLVKKYNVKKFYFASSSSVYGDSGPFPKKENSLLCPLNLYSSSKLLNEQTARIYSKKIKTKIIGLRFFTIYGEWGRPDMLILKYLISAIKKKSFELYNFGEHKRDFTYIDDAINMVLKIDKFKLKSTFEIFNICSSRPIKITKIIAEINKFILNSNVLAKPRHSADVLKTYGDNSKAMFFLKKFKFTDYKTGVFNTVNWFLNNKKLF